MEHSENQIMIKRTPDLTDLEGKGDRVWTVEEDDVDVLWFHPDSRKDFATILQEICSSELGI